MHIMIIMNTYIVPESIEIALGRHTCAVSVDENKRQDIFASIMLSQPRHDRCTISVRA